MGFLGCAGSTEFPKALAWHNPKPNTLGLGFRVEGLGGIGFGVFNGLRILGIQSLRAREFHSWA